MTMAIERKINKSTLDKIIDDMTNVVEKSKDDIFQINEEALRERTQLQRELEETRMKVKRYVAYVNDLNTKVKKSKYKLSVVSKQFHVYSEDDIRDVYEKTHALQTQLVIAEKEEKDLRKKRDDLERRIRRLSSTIEHANNIGRKVSVILTYLYEDFGQVQEVLQNAKEKKQFALKIIEAQEVERKRLSREIHDGPAQMLANILIRSEIVDLAFREGKSEQALTEVKSIRNNIHSSLQEVRRIIYDLRPMALDDLGLFPTIKKHITTMGEAHDIDIKFNLFGDERRLDSNYEVAIFRLIQEALQNALNHAEANNISVSIEMVPNQINLLIKDDGIGFEEDEEKEKEDSFGLVGMRERVELLDGKLSIISQKGQGTTVRINLPYEFSN